MSRKTALLLLWAGALSLISQTALAGTYTTGVQNNTGNVWILSNESSGNAGYCSAGGKGQTCYSTIAANDAQWINLAQAKVHQHTLSWR